MNILVSENTSQSGINKTVSKRVTARNNEVIYHVMILRQQYRE